MKCGNDDYCHNECDKEVCGGYDGGDDCTPATFCLTDGDCCGGICNQDNHACSGGSTIDAEGYGPQVP